MTTPKTEKVVETTAVVKDSIENLTEIVAAARKVPGVVKENTDEAAKRMIEERRDVRLWKETGSKGERPPTPNCDLLEALSKLRKAGGTVSEPTAAKKTRDTSKASSPRVLDADVDAKVRKLVDKDPTLTRSGSVKAFRATGASASQKRITEAYDRVTKGRPVTKKPPAKVAAAKKAAPAKTTKATPVKKASASKKAAASAKKATSAKPFRGPITKASQTRRPDRKAS